MWFGRAWATQESADLTTEPVMVRLIPDSSRGLEEAGVGRRLAWRRIILEAIGIALIVAGLIVSWPPSDDPAVPATRPFLVLVGLLLFSAGLALERRLTRHETNRSNRES